MASARPSVTKRQREQLKRERKIRKAERKAERKHSPGEGPGMDDQPVREQPIVDDQTQS